MKIIKNACLYLSLIAIFMFFDVINVNAASFGNITGGNVKDKTFKVPINDAKERVFTYDKDMVSCGGTGTSPNNNPYGRLINSDKVELSCEILSSNNTTLTLSLVDLSQNNETVSVTYEINPKITTTTKATTTTTTTTKKVELSNNANLKTLEIVNNNGETVSLTPTFSKDVYEYNATVESTIKNITVNATMEDSKANMIVSNNSLEELVSGENNKIVITVTAEDGTKKAYTVNIKREALEANATLKSLFIEEEPSFELIDNKYSYDIKIKKDINKLTFDYITSSENSIVTISGNENLKNGSKIKLLVTAEDGTKKEYVLNIIKETSKKNNKKVNIPAEKNPLIIMSLSMIAFGLIGGIIYQFKK